MKADAVLFLPHETRVKVRSDHRNIAKFRTKEDPKYVYECTVRHMRKWLNPPGELICSYRMTGATSLVPIPQLTSYLATTSSSEIYVQPEFVGRDDILQTLSDAYTVGGRVVRVLHGLGGVGYALCYRSK